MTPGLDVDVTAYTTHCGSGGLICPITELADITTKAGQTVYEDIEDGRRRGREQVAPPPL
ncbi:hypothetical protein FRB91_004774 [Serendipita sp. 411]|nr:hypothetical protein FRB91_004774 [Serendipita sp. 411]